METVLNFSSFEPRFKPGLIFSVFEGLRAGEGFKLICDQEPNELRLQFSQANLGNIDWRESKRPDGLWEVQIRKAKPVGGGCCGICGGDN